MWLFVKRLHLIRVTTRYYRLRILTQFSFVQQNLAPANSAWMSLAQKPFSFSASHLIEVSATTTRICSVIRSSISYKIPSSHTTCPPTFVYLIKQGIGTGYIVIHFQSSRIRQVSCNTLLTGQQLPCLPTYCPYSPTSFVATSCLDTLSLARFNPLRLSCLPEKAH